jgi:hypothetical protein
MDLDKHYEKCLTYEGRCLIISRIKKNKNLELSYRKGWLSTENGKWS